MRSRRQIYLLSLFITVWSHVSSAETLLGVSDVAPGISAEQLRSGLSNGFTNYIDVLLVNPKAREEYLQQYFVVHALEKKAEELKPVEKEWVAAELAVRRSRILRDAVVKSELDKLGYDIEALAKERYEVNKETYKTRRQVKLAQIFIAKKPGQEGDIKKTMDGILEQLEDDNLRRHEEEKAQQVAKEKEKKAPDDETEVKESVEVVADVEEEKDLFSELARQYSEGVHATMGGMDPRWLMLPPGDQSEDPVIQSAAELLRRGEISGVVEGEHGFHILRLMDYTPNRQQEFGDVKKQIMADIRSELWDDKDKELTLELQPPKDMPVNDELVLKVLEEVYAGRDASLKKKQGATKESVTAESAAPKAE